MKRIVQAWLVPTLFATGMVRAQAPISPAQLDVNLGPLVVDRYDGVQSNSGNIADDLGCNASSIYRTCVQQILNYYSSEGVVGVAIQLGMAGGPLGSGGSGSTPFANISGTENQGWLNNLSNFFQDVQSAQIPYVSLRLNMSGGWGGSESMAYTYCTIETSGPGSGTGPVQPCGPPPNPPLVQRQLFCYPWLPWCNYTYTDQFGSSSEQCYGCGNAYGYNNNPYLPYTVNLGGEDLPGSWGWTANSPFVKWFGDVLSLAKGRVIIREITLIDEVLLSQTPVQARMVYHNYNTEAGNVSSPVSILSTLGAVMQSRGFDPGAVIVSTESWNQCTR